jgi:S-adenosylmethionine hydrolase
VTVITLLTDFGTADYFVGAMKGAILSVNRQAIIADITHEVPPQDIQSAAFSLLAAYNTFPAGTIHVAVVDPGVGSARRKIIVSAGGHFFVGPDNGLFTYIYDRESSCEIFHVTAEKYFRQPTSTTFHGRDIFAPVAAALSTGVEVEAFGAKVNDEVRLENSLVPEVKNGRVEGRIIHIDRFGNCITNITRDVFDVGNLVINGETISKFREYYADSDRNELFAIWGSAGFLEISMNGSSAADKLRIKTGDRITGFM